MSIIRPRPPRPRGAQSKLQYMADDLSIDVAHANAAASTVLEEIKTPTLSQGAADPDTSAGMIDADLDLDLQQDVAALLQRKAARSGSTSLPSRGSGGLRHSASMDHIGAGASRIPDFLATADLDGEEMGEEEEAEEGTEDGEGEDWVGGLPREELEAMLLRATKVIRARERDLGLAASIGKALLEKNLTLRTKHEGIMRQLDNRDESFDDEQGQDGTPPLGFDDDTPSTSGRPSISIQQDALVTPMPGSMSINTDDYFSQLAEERTPHGPSSFPRQQDVFSSPSKHSLNLFPNSPQKDGLIDSQPTSPRSSGPVQTLMQATLPPSHSTFVHLQMQSAEAERQLSLLEEQNDALVSRLADLQAETEQQRKEGSRKLHTLDTELEALRNELDELHMRNAELEDASGGRLDGDTSSTRSRGKGWRRRGPLPNQKLWKDLAGRSPVAQNFAPWRTSMEDLRRAASSLSPTQSRTDISQLRGANSPARSVSVASEMSAAASTAGSATGNEQERAIVSQLLLKIKDLEEANAAITRARFEIEGKWGKAIQEGNRIRDAYEAVETASVRSSTFDGDAAAGDSSHVRPGRRSLHRRAPGNRHIIETQKTIRTALQRDRGGFSRTLTETSISSGSSTRSGKASGYSGRRASITKPKIRITPSMEGLREESKASEWKVVEEAKPTKHTLHPHTARSRSPMRPNTFLSVAPNEDDLMDDYDPSPSPSPGVAPSLHVEGLSGVSPSSSLGDMAGATPSTSMASIPQSLLAKLEALKQEHRSLGSEIGSVYGETTAPSFDDLAKFAATPSEHDRTEKLAELIRDVERFGQESVEAARLTQQVDGVTADHLKVSPRRRDRTASAPPLNDTDAMSDIADVRFPERLRASDLVAWGPGPDAQLLHTLTPQDDGNWRGDQDLLAPGSYRGHFTSEDGYELLEHASGNQPVFWADDEDFGKPITMKQAQRYGLAVEGSKAPRVRKRDMLAFAVKRALGIEAPAPSRRASKGKGRAKELPTSSSAMQIQSIEQIEEQEDLKQLLRARRLQFERAVVENKHGSTCATSSHLSEATAKALSLTPSRRRRALRKIQEERGGQPSLEEELLDVPVRRGSRAAMSRHSSQGSAPVTPRKHKSAAQDSDSRRALRIAQGPAEDVDIDEADSSEEFEVVELDPSKRRPGRRGTDYWPVATRSRYRPSVVKNRVEVASAEAVVLFTTWLTFASVVICACIYVFARGPRRILGTSGNSLPASRPHQ